MRRYGYAIGALLGLLLPTLVIVLVAARAEEMPRVVSIWPLLAALGTSVTTWWLQGLIYAVLARPQLKSLRVGEMFRVDMAGLFVALISPVRGAELPYKAYLLKRRGLSAGEGSNVVLTRVLLDAAVLTPAALVGLPLFIEFPEMQGSNVLVVGVVVIVAAVVLFVRRRRPQGRAQKRTSPRSGSGWRAKVGAKISGLLSDMNRSFASYWLPGHRTTLLYAVALTIVYWTFRLSAGPLVLMAVGWSGNWLPVVAAQLLLVSFVLPFAPTPGGSGARELGLAALLSGYVPEGQLLSGLIVYTASSHWLPLIASAFFAGHETWRGLLRGGGRKAAGGNGRSVVSTRALPAEAPTTAQRHHVLSSDQEPEGTATRLHDEASPPTDRIPGGSRA
jgi:glycosyltransferase 2 family protein